MSCLQETDRNHPPPPTSLTSCPLIHPRPRLVEEAAVTVERTPLPQ